MEWLIAIVAAGFFAILQEEGIAIPLLAAAVAWLLLRLSRLQQRLQALEKRHRAARVAGAAARRDTGQPPASSLAEPASPSTPAAAPAPSSSPGSREPSEETPAAPASDASERVDPPASLPAFDWRQNVLLRWLLSGNLPVKVGVLVSFFGVAFLLKYAVDAGWMRLPVEVRLAGVAAFGLAMLGLGWRLREGHRVYALSIQGGGIGVLYLTAFAALRLFEVLPPVAAFAIMVLVATGAAWLAIRQGARVLALLGSVGGFLAPLLASTGSGSHVALFSYYLLLNLGIVAVAWFRHWRILNLVGFTFTFAIGLAWGAEYYDREYFASVEPFLIAHFLLYTAVAVLSALRQPFRLQGYVDSALVFGLPLVAFPLQAALLDGESRPLAWSATAMAAFYAPLAWWIQSRWGEPMRLLAQVYVALAVIFATLAVPLWLDAPWVSNTWALEAAAMIAIGLRQQRALTHGAGLLLLAVATLAYIVSLPGLESGDPLLNERFIGAVVLAVAYSFCAWVYPREGRELVADLPLHWVFAAAGWFTWLALAFAEISEHAGSRSEPVLLLAAALFITLLLERLAARWAAYARPLATSLLPILLVLMAGWFDRHEHFLHGWGIALWPAAFALLAWLVDTLPRQRGWFLAACCWLAAAWACVEVDYRVDAIAGIGRSWNTAAVVAALLVLLAGLHRLIQWRYPGEGLQRMSLVPLLALGVALLAGWSIASAGYFAPLPYLPLLNLQFLLAAVALYLLLRVGPQLLPGQPWTRGALALGFLFITVEVARGTHHLVGIDFSAESLWRSATFQAGLSVTWSTLGIGAMLLGNRWSRWPLWMVGAGLMGVVVAKLFLVDLGNTGSLTRVISFIVVGLLLLVVGYFAPAPARQADTTGVTS